jgi:hypothetical protein
LPRLPEVKCLVDEKKYFTLHAPRRSGKTTALLAAVDTINGEGSYHALYCDLQTVSGTDDRAQAMSGIVGALSGALRASGVGRLKEAAGDGFLDGLDRWRDFRATPVLVWLRTLCAWLERDLVIFFDGVDCLAHRNLTAFLSQLRVGHASRVKVPFPRSLALTGMSDVARATIRRGPENPDPGIPFNIVTKSLTLAGFTPAGVEALYAQHTAATGQAFRDGAAQRAWYLSGGQPCLVNALAREAIGGILANDHGQAITGGIMERAADNLIERRDGHIGYLLSHLPDPRVARIVWPMLAASAGPVYLAGPPENLETFGSDLLHCRDLGLVAPDGQPRPANPVYATAIVRRLNGNMRAALPDGLSGKWVDGARIDMTGVIGGFQGFWAKHCEKYLRGLEFIEAGPLLFFTAFLRKAVSGAAFITNEFAGELGYAGISVKNAAHRYAIGLRSGDENLPGDRAQLLDHMGRLATGEGWLLIFNREPGSREPGKGRAGKIPWHTETVDGYLTVHTVGFLF